LILVTISSFPLFVSGSESMSTDKRFAKLAFTIASLSKEKKD
jgi:hypothetical protein